MHKPINWTCMYAFPQIFIFFFSLHGDNNSMFFKKLHFEIGFQKFTFSAPQTQLFCKWKTKKNTQLSIFSWKLCHVYTPTP